jgi:hypothetical protein
MTVRRTIVVHTKLSGHMIRVAAARSGANGVQVMTMGQLAGRLAGEICERGITADWLEPIANYAAFLPLNGATTCACARQRRAKRWCHAERDAHWSPRAV